MTRSDETRTREQRLAAKLRENLKRRKGQARARSQSEAKAPGPGRNASDPKGNG